MKSFAFGLLFLASVIADAELISPINSENYGYISITQMPSAFADQVRNKKFVSPVAFKLGRQGQENPENILLDDMYNKRRVKPGVYCLVPNNQYEPGAIKFCEEVKPRQSLVVNVWDKIALIDIKDIGIPAKFKDVFNNYAYLAQGLMGWNIAGFDNAPGGNMSKEGHSYFVAPQTALVAITEGYKEYPSLTPFKYESYKFEAGKITEFSYTFPDPVFRKLKILRQQPQLPDLLKDGVQVEANIRKRWSLQLEPKAYLPLDGGVPGTNTVSVLPNAPAPSTNDYFQYNLEFNPTPESFLEDVILPYTKLRLSLYKVAPQFSIDMSGEGDVNVQLERLDVDDVLVTREDGTEFKVDGTYTVEWFSEAENRWQHIYITGTEPDRNSKDLYIFPTGTGLDVVPGFQYRVTVDYEMEDGLHREKYEIDFR